MSTSASLHTAHSRSTPAPTFQIDGRVVAVLPGSGLATLHTNSADELTVSRGTDGVHFEQLCVGDWLTLNVAIGNYRVIQARHQTLPMAVPLGAQRPKIVDVQDQAPPRSTGSGVMNSRRPSMTKEEFIAQYCRHWGLAWADLAMYRVALPSDDAAGWTMVSIASHDDEQTVQGPLEPYPEH